MSAVHEILKEVGALKANPRDVLAKERLKGGLKSVPADQFIAQVPDGDIGEMIWRAARRIVLCWERETERMTWIDCAAFLLKRMEKPKGLPPVDRGGDAADLKARAAGEGEA